MRLDNNFRFSGNLGTDPEIRDLPSGGKVARLSMGVDASFKNSDGEKVDRTEWMDLTCYSPGLIGVIEKYLRKGREITAGGHVRKEKWESKDRKDADGNPAIDSRYAFVLTELKFHGSGKDHADTSGQSYRAEEEMEGAGA